jgi:hypothetical protein
VDVLVHVLVQHSHGVVIGRVAGAAGNFAVLDPGELVVLLPDVGLDDLGRGEKAENRFVALGESPTCGGGRRVGQEPARAQSSNSGRP